MPNYPPPDVKVRFRRAIKTDGDVGQPVILGEFIVEEPECKPPEYYKKGESLWWEITAFDWALPQIFLQQCYDLDMDPSGCIVWCYDDHTNGGHMISGCPLAVNERGKAILRKLNSVNKV